MANASIRQSGTSHRKIIATAALNWFALSVKKSFVHKITRVNSLNDCTMKRYYISFIIVSTLNNFVSQGSLLKQMCLHFGAFFFLVAPWFCRNEYFGCSQGKFSKMTTFPFQWQTGHFLQHDLTHKNIKIWNWESTLKVGENEFNLNSLVPGRFGCDFKILLYLLVSWGIFMIMP